MLSNTTAFVCLNGRFVSEKDATVSVFDRGFIYGDGLFTTIRAENGKPFFLKEHLNRMKKSSVFFRIKYPDALKEKDIIEKLLNINDLQKGYAAVKIIITRGTVKELGLPIGHHPTWLITARAYTPPGEKQYEEGWHLFPIQRPGDTPVADHKTLNYLYNLWARQRAIDAGAHEALLMDTDGYILETATGTILVQSGKEWITPKAQGVLPGITLKMIGAMWSSQGRKIKEGRIMLEDMSGADRVWILNSLIGIMPVKKIDQYTFPQDSQLLAERSRHDLWEYAKTAY